MSFFQDVRFAIRMLLHRPGFLLLAGISLTVGIGASTAVFSILHTLLLQRLRVASPKELVGLYLVSRGTQTYSSFSYLNYLDLRNRSRSLRDVIAYGINPFNLSTGSGAERVWGDLATANYFSVLGVPAMLGRTFLPEEDHTPGAHPVVILSYPLWARRFGSDPRAIGEHILLNGRSYTVIGVTPESFRGTELGLEPDLWIPMMMQAQAMPGWDALPQRGSGWLRAVGRLKPGISLNQARADCERIALQLDKEFPRENEGMTIALVPDFSLLPQFRGKVRGLVLILASLVSTLLLVSCVNLAGLLLARTSARVNEFAMRTALGAARGRLIRQLLTESFLLSLFGGVGGILLAAWLVDIITKFQSSSPLPSVVRFEMNTTVLFFALLISVTTGLVFGLVPALHATRDELAMSIKAHAGRGARISKVRSLLVVVQIAMAFILLVAAGLFVKSFRQATRIAPGFAANRTVQLSFDLGAQGYTEDRAKAFARSLLANVDRQPGVTSSALVTLEPLGLSDRDTSVFFEGLTSPSAARGVSINYNAVSETYLRTMSIPILAGRSFTRTDNEHSAPVVVINETMAHRFWPGVRNVVGRRISLASANGPFLEIVGVCGDSKYISIAEQPLPYFYLPLAQNFPMTLTLVAAGTGDPVQLLGVLGGQVHRLDGSLPLYHKEAMRQRIRANLTIEDFVAKMLTFFGLTALLLATVGVYGVLSQLAQQRTRETGIRMALGATKRDVLLQMIRRGMTIAAGGLTAGIAAAYFLSSALGSRLIQVDARDPLVFVLVTGLLAVAALLASLLPSYRATRVDPTVALRYE